jgi:SAM-dependent methyltransferase
MHPDPIQRWLNSNDINLNIQRILHRYHTAALGGPLPAAIPLTNVRHILNTSCGPGDWAIDIARTYPLIHVTGIDANEEEIQHARLNAQLCQVSERVTFQHMPVGRSLAFADNTFDLIHTKPIQQLHPARWPFILQELIRVLRPGGWLNVVAHEWGVTSSDALNHLTLLANHAASLSLYRLGLLAERPASGYEPGVGPFLYQFLIEGGLIDVSYTIHAVDLGAFSKQGARIYTEAILLFLAHFKSLVCELELVDEYTYDSLLRTARKDMLYQPGSCGFAYLFSAHGRKSV